MWHLPSPHRGKFADVNTHTVHVNTRKKALTRITQTGGYRKNMKPPKGSTTPKVVITKEEGDYITFEVGAFAEMSMRTVPLIDAVYV